MAVIGLQGNASYLFMNFSAFLAGLSEALPSIERVMELLESEKDPEMNEIGLMGENGNQQEQGGSEYAIELKKLCFGYEPDQWVLDQFDMTVKKGELVLIKGESGCGKSTLYKILLGFYPAAKGEYLLDGVRAESMGQKRLAEKYAYLDQSSYLFSMSVAENIRLSRQEASASEVEEAAKLAGAHEFIRNLPQGYDTILSDGSDNISGGQRQRIAMARMFLSDRPILLIDEGTANIDEETEGIVAESIRRMKGKKTIIMITHKDTMCPWADQIYQVGK